MNTPVLRRLRKNGVGSTPLFRVVVFGQSGVGKTAFSVRFVTKRFIGEYDPTIENIYQHSRIIDSALPVFFEIMDTAGQEHNSVIMEEKMRWGDAYVLMYSINDKLSFDEIPRLKFLICHTVSHIHQQHKRQPVEPIIAIVGNKTDLDLERMVPEEKGRKLAENLNCIFFEISVRDSVTDVNEVFESIYRAHREKVFNSPTSHEHSGGSFRKKSFKHIDKIPRMAGKEHKTYIESVEDTKKKMAEMKPRWSDGFEGRKSSKRHKHNNDSTLTRPRRNAIVNQQYMEMTGTQSHDKYPIKDTNQYFNDHNGNITTKRCLSQEVPTYTTIDTVDALEQFVHRRVALKETVT